MLDYSYTHSDQYETTKFNHQIKTRQFSISIAVTYNLISEHLS